MPTLRTLFALRPTIKTDSGRMVEKMRDRAGYTATLLNVRAKPQRDSRKPRL
jgi:hypothetical protein